LALLYLLICCIPLGVAGQNIGLAIVSLSFFYLLYKKSRSRSLVWMWSQFRTPVVVAGLLVLGQWLAGILNPISSHGWDFKFVGGHMTWVLLPLFSVALAPALALEDWKNLHKCIAAIAITMGGIALSQFVFGWRIQGTQLVEDAHRARGLYSHPLTLAYVGLLVLGPGLNALFNRHRCWLNWLWVVGATLVIIFSLSKTVIACALIMLFVLILFKLRGQTKIIAITFLVLCSVTVVVTDNPISRRYSHILRGVDVEGGKIDDRVVFWQVHWEMAKERLWLGHGPDLNSAYRKPYYENAGYGNLTKQYEAHNVFLQILVNGGLFSLLLFIAWWFWHLKKGWEERDHWVGFAALLVSSCFLLASVTQNSFQDSEVRYSVAVSAAFFWLFLRSRIRDEMQTLKDT
jgi:O-antigen ligase